MNKFGKTSILLAMASMVSGTVVLAAAEGARKLIEPPPAPEAPPKVKVPSHPEPAIPLAEPATRVAITPNSGFATTSAFTSATASSVSPSTALTPPVTITYSGSSDAITVTDSGTGRGETLSLSNTSNNNSAFYGETYGSGAGLTGYNKGTSGPGGKFAVVNAASAQPGTFSTTNGTGPAVLGTVTTANSVTPALWGQNTRSNYYGIGVEGDGNEAGLYGTTTTGEGVFGYASNGGTAVYGQSASGIGGSFTSTSNYGVSATSTSNYAVYASTNYGGAAIYATSASNAYAIEATIGQNGIAIQGNATGTEGYGVEGYATGDASVGVIGISEGSDIGLGPSYGGYFQADNGIGLYASGAIAAEFNGNVVVTGTVVATSFSPSSDRNLKTDIEPIDGKDILERVTQLPITYWQFKSDKGKRHVGPMAQDFHAAFGFDGKDDTHINLTDSAGVSLAAIQELSKQMKLKDAQMREKDAQMREKDSQIAELRAQLATQAATQTKALDELTQQFSARLTLLEQRDRHSEITMAKTVMP